MKKFLWGLLTLCLLFSTLDSMAASDKKKKRVQDKIRAKGKNEKLAKNNSKWHTDIKRALSEARQNRRQVFLLITGSTWCGPCQMLESKVLASKDFARFAQKNLVLLKVDSPSGKNKKLTPQAMEILKKYHNTGGVPSVYILDANGRKIETQSGYGGQKPQDYIKRFKKLKKAGK